MADNKLYIKERDILFEIMQSGDNEEVIRWYDENAILYDEQFNSCGFIYHLTTTETVCKVAPDKTAVILDVGAGSGVIGKLLHDHGYCTIDAVDASEGMLKIAAQKNIYRSLTCAKIGTEPIKNLKECEYL
ncbi:Methyltransferase-like protein 27 [Holothuria leucospilota]|uniref:Methyltransferase-like protein 27 n=1 Tax=Holothuria leucospilota TaxID=206669 RepID=A0A9Q1HGE9_HOLLE|nr:Methyltransferase-like protein 27 [Holothuria leucospilota]